MKVNNVNRNNSDYGKKIHFEAKTGDVVLFLVDYVNQDFGCLSNNMFKITQEMTGRGLMDAGYYFFVLKECRNALIKNMPGAKKVIKECLNLGFYSKGIYKLNGIENWPNINEFKKDIVAFSECFRNYHKNLRKDPKRKKYIENFIRKLCKIIDPENKGEIELPKIELNTAAMDKKAEEFKELYMLI